MNNEELDMANQITILIGVKSMLIDDIMRIDHEVEMRRYKLREMQKPKNFHPLILEKADEIIRKFQRYGNNLDSGQEGQ